MDDEPTPGDIKQVLVEDARPFWEVVDSIHFPGGECFVKSYYENPFVIQRRLATGNELFFLLRNDGDYVGAAGLVKRTELGSASVPILAVKEQVRRRGHATRLLGWCIATARAASFERLYANVPARNTPACMLFTKHEFVPECLWRDLYGDGVDVVSYVLDLGAGQSGARGGEGS